jgi:hypothetical protein
MKVRYDMRFKNTRLITAGVDLKVSPLLQLFLWHCIDAMPPPKDYLQIFNCTIFDGKQKITHIQEEPEYKREYLLNSDIPIFIGKIFVIDDKTHSTMLLASEY